MDICLMKDNKKCSKKVHILVANTFIANPGGKACVDHIDNIKSNNNINNLRWATYSENQQNRTITKNNTSNVKGVSWHKLNKNWVARIQIDGIAISLGSFTNIEDAKQARMIRANQAFGIYTNACEKII